MQKMLKSLKIHLRESTHPVGVKKSYNIKLPSLDYVYGYKPKQDLERAGKSKFIIKNKNKFFINFSCKWLEIS